MLYLLSVPFGSPEVFPNWTKPTDPSPQRSAYGSHCSHVRGVGIPESLATGLRLRASVQLPPHGGVLKSHPDLEPLESCPAPALLGSTLIPGEHGVGDHGDPHSDQELSDAQAAAQSPCRMTCPGSLPFPLPSPGLPPHNTPVLLRCAKMVFLKNTP